MAATLSSRTDMLAMTFASPEQQTRGTLHTFLSLAPTTSASYPTQTPAAKIAVEVVVAAEEGKSVVTAEPFAVFATPVMPADKVRRSSSLSSDGSMMQKRRFLRLGPVHFGVGEGDWSEEVVE